VDAYRRLVGIEGTLLVIPIEACGPKQSGAGAASSGSNAPGLRFLPAVRGSKVLLGIPAYDVEERQMQARLGVDEADLQVFWSKLAGTVQFRKSVGEHNAPGGGQTLGRVPREAVPGRPRIAIHAADRPVRSAISVRKPWSR
jgi:hypothetical protein